MKRTKIITIIAIVAIVGMSFFVFQSDLYAFKSKSSGKKSKVSDILPLKHGLYVEEDTPCEVVPRWGGRYYDGTGLNNGADVSATIIKVHNEGNTYHITERFEYEGKMEGTPSSTEKETIVIKSQTSFSIPNNQEEQKRTGEKETVYRLCGDE